MSKKYQYLAIKRKSAFYERALDITTCKFKKSHIYTSNCSYCLKNAGRTRYIQQCKLSK